MPPRLDDESVGADAILWRVMRYPAWIKTTDDGLRPSSHCFKDNTVLEGDDRSDHETSVFLMQPDFSPELLLEHVLPNIGYVAWVTAGNVREQKFIVARDPEFDVEGARHYVITPRDRDIRISVYNKLAERIAKSATLRNRA